MGADMVIERAKHLLRWIEHAHANSFSRRDLHQALRGTFKRVNDLNSPLAMLVSHSFIRERPEISEGRPGRPPSPVYEVNPLWVPQNVETPQNTGREANFEDFEDSEEPIANHPNDHPAGPTGLE